MIHKHKWGYYYAPILCPISGPYYIMKYVKRFRKCSTCNTVQRLDIDANVWLPYDDVSIDVLHHCGVIFLEEDRPKSSIVTIQYKEVSNGM